MNTRSRFNRAQWSALALPLLLCAAAQAQTILAPPAFDTFKPVGTERAGAVVAGPGFLAGVTSALASNLPLFRRGDFAVRPHFVYRAIRSTGIQVERPEPLDTTMQTIAPGLTLQTGAHWEADYTPTWSFYSNREFKDSFDQVASASGLYDFSSWSLGVSGSYSSAHPILVEFARQTHETNYGGQVRATFKLTKKTSVETSLAQDYRRATPVRETPEWLSPNNRTWSSRDTLMWTATDRLKLAAGASFGTTEGAVGPSMFFYRPIVQANWTATEKINVNAEGGYEDRQFRHSNAERLRSPYYSGSIKYRPFEVTTISLLASHGVAVAYLANTVTKIDAWRIDVNQRLLGRLYVGVGYTNQNTDYLEARSNLPVTRGDRFENFEVRLSTAVLARGSASLFYNQNHNRSSQRSYRFDSRQYGLEISFRF